MQLVALTGGIASGKSAVAARLAERGAVIVDADRVAREVVEPGMPALARIADEFGPEYLAADGTLDRARLGALIFADPAKRHLLNSITHPAVGDRSRELFACAGAADPDAIVVYDVPLLVDGDRTDEFELVVVVIASEEERVRRMVELRGLSREEAERRIASQASDDERLAIADVVIDANGTLDETRAQADALWDRLRSGAND